MTSIAFIGPGIMGAPMIKNLVSSGHNVRAFGRSQTSRNRITAAGAIPASSPRAAAAAADVVITMLPDTPDVERVVVSGADPLIDALTPDQTYIDMSTIRPDVTRKINAALAERGVGMLDAPVSGGEAGAIEGTLSIMVGGSARVLDPVRPVLACMGSTITHVGPAGAGQLTKAANQLVVAANIQAAAEAVVLLESAGADVAAALDAIGGGLGGSTVLDRKRAAFLRDAFDPGFRIELHHKDLRIVRDTADATEIGLPLTGTVSQVMLAAMAKGYGQLDHSALLKVVRDLNRSSDK